MPYDRQKQVRHYWFRCFPCRTNNLRPTDRTTRQRLRNAFSPQAIIYLLLKFVGQHISPPPTSLGKFHQHFTCSFYVHRSQKCKKDNQLKQLFALLGSVHVKAERKQVDEMTAFLLRHIRRLLKLDFPTDKALLHLSLRVHCLASHTLLMSGIADKQDLIK